MKYANVNLPSERLFYNDQGLHTSGPCGVALVERKLPSGGVGRPASCDLLCMRTKAEAKPNNLKNKILYT